MGQTFEIIPQSSTVTVQAGQTVKAAFTLTNTKPAAIDVQVSLDTGTPEPLPWVTLVGPGLRSVGPNEVQTLEVTVAPPADSPDDVATLKVVVASTTNPEADWATSPGLSLRVGKGDGPAWKKWLPLVVGLVLILGVGIGLAVWLSGRGGGEGKVGQACDAEVKCPVGLVCTARPGGGGSVCLAGDGTTCVTNEECQSGFCDGEKTSCARPPVHSPCEGAACFAGQTCADLGGQKLCVWKNGEACAADLECENGFCKALKCVAYDGKCADDGACRDTERCVGDMCLLRDGQACADNVSCASGDCADGTCKAAGQASTGVCGSGCPPGQICTRNGCMGKRRPGRFEIDRAAAAALAAQAEKAQARVKASAALNAKRAEALKKAARER
jgi:hypothetical protein